MNCHSWEDDFRSARCVPLTYLGLYPASCLAHETCLGEGFEACFDASLAGEPYEGMHDKMAKNY